MQNLSIKAGSAFLTNVHRTSLRGRIDAIRGNTRPVILLLAVLLGGSLLFAGCGSTKVTSQTNESVGQQLLDLEKARKDGLINDKEYERLRRATIKKND